MLLRMFLLLFFVISQSGFCTQAIEMREKIEALGSDHHFTFVDLGFSSDEINEFEQFNVHSKQDYRRYGDLHLLLEELPIFLGSIGTNNEKFIQKMTNQIYLTALNVAEAAGKETAWVDVRVTLPNTEFDTPRWHTDGCFFIPMTGTQFKFAAVLKGNPTLFYQITHDLRKVLNSFQKTREYHDDFNERESFSKFLDKTNIQSPQKGQGVFFLVGDENNSATHSEPKMDSERIFFSVVPGNIDEIQQLKERWND